MNEKETEEKIEDLQIGDVQEFKVTSEEKRKERRKMETKQVPVIGTMNLLQKRIAVMCLFAVVALLVILAGVLGCHVSVLPVCVLLVIQVLICVLLDQNPVWLHGCVILAELIVGIATEKTVLMLLLIVIYIAATLALEGLQRLRE